MQPLLKNNPLADILTKVEAGERLSREDGIRLMESNDILMLGYMADMVRKSKHGDRVYFIVNKHINHTNICKARCKLCAFGKDADDPGAYLMTLDEVEAKAKECQGKRISELHIVGGLHPDLNLEYFEEMLQRVSRVLPGVHIQAFTAVEIDYFAETSGLTPKEVLQRLQDAGLGSMPGGGAEIFSSRVRNLICEKKISGDRWLEIMEAAHSLGMRTNATMLYGHVETTEERIDHLIKLRELQDRTGGFLTFIPLAFHPRNTQLEELNLSRTTGYEDLKVLAVARLMLDNFDHIKAYWVMIGPKLAQVSLAFGANDLDGTVIEERITHAAGGDTGQSLTKSEMVKMIKGAGRVPIERDTLYNIVEEGF
ncbi:MAG: aminofutalosine synthase MqnE [Clostridia bacterium]|nr:aminofutalosine synthase MqnE [Clostridia bacterium]